jgi:hypothetical protein
MPLTRRSFFAGALGALVVAGVAMLEAPRLLPNLFTPRYPRSPYDDLFALLPDRENAARLGTAVLRGRAKTDMGTTAQTLRQKIGGHSLARAMARDVAENRLVEAQGWLLPESLADICALAAMAESA